MSLLSLQEINLFTGIFSKHFETFAEEIIIFKEPIQRVNSNINPNTPVMAGYNNDAIQTSITFIPVSGVFSGIVNYRNNIGADTKVVADLNIRTMKGEMILKVEQNTRDFIKNGKTELFQVDGKSFNQIVDERVQNYLGLKYYYFGLENGT